MTVPVDGGTASELVRGSFGYQCARAPSHICVLFERHDAEGSFYLLDAKRGRANKPFGSEKNVIGWSLSPDGQQIAIAGDALQLCRIDNTMKKRLDLGKWQISRQLQSVAWFSNGSGLFVTSFGPSGTALLSVDLAGHVSVLQQGRNWLCCQKTSPDGRLLAFSLTQIEHDVVLLENF